MRFTEGRGVLVKIFTNLGACAPLHQRHRYLAPVSAPPLSAGPDPATPLATLPFAVVDVETTGTVPENGDRITEIAVVRVHGGIVGAQYARLINPQRTIPGYISALTGISNAMVRDEPPFRDRAPEIRSLLDGAVFTAHNAAFDWRFVQAELVRSAVAPLDGPRLCTVRMARLFLPQLPRRSLDAVTTHFGIGIAARHRAAGDALATAHALCRLLALATDAGLTTWGALEAYLAPRARRRIMPPVRSRLPLPPHAEDRPA
jgi:DNA polymerase-3 subunit epsilon